MLPRPPVHLDPDRLPPTVDRRFVDALEAYHFTSLQALFAAEVMYLGGVFLAVQAETWLDSHWPEYGCLTDAAERHSYCARFLQDLFAPVGKLKPVAASFHVPDCNRQYAHCNSRYFYRVVGLEHSRYQRIEKNVLALTRLLNYDYIVRHSDFTWYGATDQKKALFEALGVPRRAWPVRLYRSQTRPSAPPKPAYFPDHNPIGLSGWHLLFLVPLTYGDSAGGLRRMVDRYYAPLWRELRRRGFRVTLVLSRRPGVLPTLPDGLTVPASLSDRRIVVNAVTRYLYELAVEVGDGRLLDAQGGLDAVCQRHAQLEREARAAPQPSSGLMDLVFHECPHLSSAARDVAG